MKQNKLFSTVMAAAGLGLICAAPVTRACELTITWQADLTAPNAATPPVKAPATAKAAIAFDFANPGATVQVNTGSLRDVRAIELHVARSYTDHTGPAVLTLYAMTEGPLPAMLTRRVTEADLHRQTAPRVTTFADVVSAVVNGRAYVTVATQAHPEGELSGFIRMHKEEIYSDSASDPAHDPALHHAALPHPITSPKP